MEDLILKVRYQSLRSNLSRVRDLIDDLNTRRKQVDDIVDALDEANRSLRRTELDLLNLANDLTDGDSESNQNLPKKIREIADRSRKLYDTLEGPKRTVENLQAVCKYLNPQAKDMSIANVLGAGLPAPDPESWVQRLEDLYLGLLQTPAMIRDKAWDEYRGELYNNSQQLFRDYVQLLGGLAVRDMELDRKICRFADELLKRYTLAGSADERLLTIPTRQEAVRMTWSRVVRLGFPEWSIWALPYIAHELWFVVARKKLQNPAVQNLELRQELCLADAFATWTVGPAYAYAAVLLQLNPWPGNIDGVEYAADDDRFRAIIYALQRTGLQGKVNRYHTVIRELQQAWADAQRRDSTTIEADAGTQARIDALFTDLNTKLPTQFPPENWDKFQEWTPLMQEGRTDPNQYRGIGAADGRWVLNAAWAARVSSIQDTEKIEAAATRLLETLFPERLMKSKRAAPGA